MVSLHSLELELWIFGRHFPEGSVLFALRLADSLLRLSSRSVLLTRDRFCVAGGSRPWVDIATGQRGFLAKPLHAASQENRFPKQLC